jgi:hypothetical protein
MLCLGKKLKIIHHAIMQVKMNESFLFSLVDYLSLLPWFSMLISSWGMGV